MLVSYLPLDDSYEFLAAFSPLFQNSNFNRAEPAQEEGASPPPPYLLPTVGGGGQALPAFVDEASMSCLRQFEANSRAQHNTTNATEKITHIPLKREVALKREEDSINE